MVLSVACCISTLIIGCRKSSDDITAEDPTIVAIAGNDLNADGTISERGMREIQARAGGAGIAISFVRSKLSDDGLNQLAMFPNLRRVEAIDSRITPEGIRLLKAAIPNVEVI